MARTDPVARAGYTLIEMLIVLAIMAIATALVVPAAETFRDQLVAHAVQFEFQNDVSELRRAAYRSETAIKVVSPDAKLAAKPAADPEEATPARALTLRAGWSYRLTQPLRISEGGVCADADVEVLKAGRTAMRLTSRDGACHFIRQ